MVPAAAPGPETGMGSKFVHFSCHHCNHCCTEVVCLPTPRDVRRIVEETGANPYAFLEFVGPDEISEVAGDDPTWLEVNGRRYLMALRRDSRGCYFLNGKTGFCSIYEARPLLCRLYPFQVQEAGDGEFLGFTLHDDVGCPRHRDGRVPVEPLRAIYTEDNRHQKAYATLVRAFNRNQYRAKKPEHFLRLFLNIDDGEARALRRRAEVRDRRWKGR